MRNVVVSQCRAEQVVSDLGGLRSVYVVDEDPIVRRENFVFLSGQGFAPVSFKDVKDFVDNIDHLPPGCLILGGLTEGFGPLRLIETLGHRIAEFPVIVTASNGDVATAVQAMKLGASDVLELPFGRDVLPAMLKSLLMELRQRLSRIMSARTARALVQGLSAREAELLRHLLLGYSNKAIGSELKLSLRTVEMHRASMMVRLGVNNLADALRVAFEAGVGTAAYGSGAADGGAAIDNDRTGL